MFTRRIMALAAALFTALTITATTAGATTITGHPYHNTVIAAGSPHHFSPVSRGRWR